MSGNSFLDKAKEIGLKARDAVAKNSDKIDGAVDKAADFVDTRTKGKYADKIGKAKSAAHDALGKLDDSPPDAGPAATTPDPSGPTAATPDPAGPTATTPDPAGPAAATPEPPVAPPDPGAGDRPVAKPDPEAPGPG